MQKTKKSKSRLAAGILSGALLLTSMTACGPGAPASTGNESDANFPSESIGKRVIRLDGERITALLESVMPFFVLIIL